MKKIICLLSLIAFFACVDSKKQIPREKIVPFEFKKFNNEFAGKKLERVDPLKELKIYSTTNIEEAQVKTLSSFDDFQIFLLNDDATDFYQVEIALLGEKPQNIKGYVFRNQLKEKTISYFDSLDFGEVGSEDFRRISNIKQIDEETYRQLKKRGISLIHPSSEGIQKLDNGTYAYHTNDGEWISIDKISAPIGFCTVLQSYVFKSVEGYYFYSKLHSSREPIVFENLPLYNKAQDLLIELTNESEQTVSISLYKIDSELYPKITKSYILSGFLVVENSTHWISDYVCVTKVMPPNANATTEDIVPIQIQFLPVAFER